MLPQGDGSSITVEPGLILGEVNRLLAAHAKKHKLPIQYKMGPDPSSIDSCMIGGVVSNNSSGMCCGVSQNTYHTLKVSHISSLATAQGLGGSAVLGSVALHTSTAQRQQMSRTRQ